MKPKNPSGDEEQTEAKTHIHALDNRAKSPPQRRKESTMPMERAQKKTKRM